MVVLLGLLGFAVLIYVSMIGLILFSGTIEARKKGRDQDRPDARDDAQPAPDVRKGHWPSS